MKPTESTQISWGIIIDPRDSIGLCLFLYKFSSFAGENAICLRMRPVKIKSNQIQYKSMKLILNPKTVGRIRLRASSRLPGRLQGGSASYRLYTFLSFPDFDSGILTPAGLRNSGQAICLPREELRSPLGAGLSAWVLCCSQQESFRVEMRRLWARIHPLSQPGSTGYQNLGVGRGRVGTRPSKAPRNSFSSGEPGCAGLPHL